MPIWHLSDEEAGCSHLSAIRNVKLDGEWHWEHWRHNVESRVVFLPPSCISLWGRGWVAFLFSAGTPHWVRHRFQRIQMCSVAHKAFLYRSGVRTGLACWLRCVVLGREVVRQRFSSAVGSPAQCVKWVQTFYVLTHELCWVPCEGVNAMCCIQVTYHMYLEPLINLIRTNGAYIQSSIVYKY